MWRWEDVKMRRCEDVRMWRWEDVRRCEKMWEDEKMWRWEDVKMWGCEDEKMWRWEDVKKGESKRARGQEEKMWRCEDVKMRRCEDEKMWRCEEVKIEDVRRCEKMWEDVRRWEDVKMRRCEDVRMWRWEDVKMWGCEDVKMRRCEKMWEDVRRCEDEKMRRRWEDEKMWSWEDVKMWGCEDEKMWRCEDVRMWRWEDVRRCEKMWEDVKMRCEDEKKMRCEDEKMFYRPPLLEEHCAQTLSGKTITQYWSVVYTDIYSILVFYIFCWSMFFLLFPRNLRNQNAKDLANQLHGIPIARCNAYRHGYSSDGMAMASEISRRLYTDVLLWMEEILHQLMVYPIIYRVSTIQGGAGFLPSTVAAFLMKCYLGKLYWNDLL